MLLVLEIPGIRAFRNALPAALALPDLAGLSERRFSDS
jgi:hypothetical protein